MKSRDGENMQTLHRKAPPTPGIKHGTFFFSAVSASPDHKVAPQCDDYGSMDIDNFHYEVI